MNPEMLPLYLLYAALPGACLCLLLSRSDRRPTVSDTLVWSIVSQPAALLIGLTVVGLGGGLSLAGGILDAAIASLLVAAGYKLTRESKPSLQLDRTTIYSALGILLLFIPMLSSRNWFAFHGFWHTTIANSLVAGQFPPDNPGLAGSSVSYVWLYHLWLALISIKTGIHSVLLNVIAHIHLLFALLGLTLLIAREWGWNERKGSLVFWVIVGAVNAGAWIHFLPYLAHWSIQPEGFLGSLERHIDTNLHPFLCLTGTFLKIPVVYKAWSFLIKFYNVGAMAHGIVFFAIYAWTLNRVIFSPDSGNRVLFSLALFGVLLFYPVYMLAVVAYAVITGIAGLATDRGLLKPLSIAAILSALCCLASLPYYLMIGTEVGSTDIPIFSIRFDPQYLWFYFAGPFWPLIPFVAWWYVKVRPRDDNRSRVVFVQSGLILSACAPVLLAIAGGPANYKYVFTSAFFVGFATVASMVALQNKRWIQRIVPVIVSGPIVLTVAGWSFGTWFDQENLLVSREGLHLSEGPAANAMSWINTRGSNDAVILLPLTRNSVKADEAYLVTALAGRPAFLTDDRTWTRGDASFKDRESLVEWLWGLRTESPHIRSEVIDNRRLYAVLGADASTTQRIYAGLLPDLRIPSTFSDEEMFQRLQALNLSYRRVYHDGESQVVEISPTTQLAGVDSGSQR